WTGRTGARGARSGESNPPRGRRLQVSRVPQSASRRAVWHEVVSATVYFRLSPDKEQSGGNGSERRDQAGLRVRAQAPSLHRRARGSARVDEVVGAEGAHPERRGVRGELLARLGPAPDGRARLRRPLLPRGVRRAGRRLLLLAGPS